MNSGFMSAKLFVATPKRLWAVAIGVFIISFSFALYTNHAWEDWYITYRASKNLALGTGLVFTVGERVHSFTSPLGTLIPALLSFIVGNASDDLVLWLFRIICCSLLSLTAVLLLRIAQAAGMFMLPTALMVGLFAFDAKIIDFSINGQETAFMMFFLVAVLYVLTVPSKHFVVKLGLSCAGLMWTRPDSFIYIGALVVGCLLFKPESPHFNSRMELAKKILCAGIVALFAYLPWTLWTWYYYGTPIPHTIIAKGFVHPVGFIELIRFIAEQTIAFPYRSIMENSSLTDTFAPPYAKTFGGWNGGLLYVGKALAFVCSYYWCLPGGKSLVRAVSFAVFLAHLYLSVLTPFVYPWYVPSVTILSVFVLAHIAQQVAVIAHDRKNYVTRILYVCGGAILLYSAGMALATGYEMKLQQEIIENGNRKKIGLWLKEHAASPKDTVFLECLGYIGFYSQLKMLDFPGLSSPEVVAARRKLNADDYAVLIRFLRPDWLVLRPNEIDQIEKQAPTLLTDNYLVSETFVVADRINSYSSIPGRPYLQYDQSFVVFKNNSNFKADETLK